MALKECTYLVIPTEEPNPKTGGKIHYASKTGDTGSSPPSPISFDPSETVDVKAEFVKVTCYKTFFGWKREAFVNFVPLAFRNPRVAERKRSVKAGLDKG